MRTSLLRWYDANARDMPWRSEPSPYRTWVSEVMLQQTRVDTVRDYFARWIARFPTIESLAAADEQDVLTAWQGLGYYSRARNLHRGAQQLCAMPTLPADAKAWQTIPGVGRYTAGAIASIALGQASAVLDGNVMRVFARVFGIADDIAKPKTQTALWAVADEWVQGPRPGDFNQALMELGATVCTPKNTACDRCPWEDRCAARRTGRVSELPVKAKKAKPTSSRHFGYRITSTSTGEVLLAQRPATGLLAGLWEHPMLERDSDASARAVWREATTGRLDTGSAHDDIVHVFTHRRWTVTPVSADVHEPFDLEELSARLEQYVTLRWCTAEDAQSLPTSRLADKLAEAFGAAQTRIEL
ncbi:MAG: A/G-specific adenine glycosylase [Bradymonadia bacterium]|jgi:A/G-specific adenine glycosylase